MTISVLRCALCVTLLAMTRLCAYAALEDVTPIDAMWTSVPTQPLSAGASLAYRVVRGEDNTVLLTVRNAGQETAEVQCALPDYQVDPARVHLQAAAGTTTTLMIPVQRYDHDCNEAAVRMHAVRIGTQSLALRMPGPAPMVQRAFPATVRCADGRFHDEVITYSLMPGPDGRVDLHVLNRSRQIVHADFILVDWQPEGTRNPRLHVLPGVTQEFLLPIENIHERISAACMDVWNVRVGPEDSGPAVASDPSVRQRWPDPDPGWSVVGLVDEGLAGYDPRALVAQLGGVDAAEDTVANAPTYLELSNRGAVAIQGMVELIGGDPSPIGPYLFELAPEQRQRIPLPDGLRAARRVVVSRAVRRVGHDERVVPATPVNSAVTLPATARIQDPRWNPLALRYRVGRAGDGATITWTSQYGLPLRFDWLLPGYQDKANVRVDIPAGGQVTVTVPLLRVDARLPLAKAEVWNVQAGNAQEPLWCVPVSSP